MNHPTSSPTENDQLVRLANWLSHVPCVKLTPAQIVTVYRQGTMFLEMSPPALWNTVHTDFTFRVP